MDQPVDWWGQLGLEVLGVLVDREQARPFWQEYLRLMVQEAAYIPLYYPQRLAGISERLRGVTMDIRGDFPSVAEWWILPGRRGAASTARGADTAGRDSGGAGK